MPEITACAAGRMLRGEFQVDFMLKIGELLDMIHVEINLKMTKTRFLFSWPNSRCAVMGSEQLSGVLDIVFRQGMRGVDISPEMEAEASRRKKAMNDQIEIESNVYVTSGKMIDDAVIDPRDTRHVIGMCLSVIYNAEVKGANLHGVSRL